MTLNWHTGHAACVDYSVVDCFDYSYCFGACVDVVGAIDERAHCRRVVAAAAAVDAVAAVVQRFGWRGRLQNNHVRLFLDI